MLLLKGFYFADRLYGGLEGRPQYDIDVLVRRQDFRATARILAQLGFARKGHDLHSVDFVRDDLKIDVHRFLRWAPAFALDERTVWETAAEARIEGLTIQTLSDEYSLVFLAMACFEDIGQGMGRLKQLLDLYLFLLSVDATMDWDAFFLRRGRENLLTITVNVFALVTDLFEARDDLAHLSAALDQRRDPPVPANRTAALALVSAPRKCQANLLWFGRVYPGSLPHYLAWFWYAGFPANLWRLGPAWALAHLRLATQLARARRTDVARSGERVAPLHWRGRYLAGLILGGAVLAQFLLIVYLGDRAYWDVLRAVSFGAGSRKASSRSAPTWTKPRRSSALCSGIAWESSSASPASRPSTSEHSSRSSPCSTRSDAVCTNGE